MAAIGEGLGIERVLQKPQAVRQAEAKLPPAGAAWTRPICLATDAELRFNVAKERQAATFCAP